MALAIRGRGEELRRGWLKKGFDLHLLRTVAQAVPVPVIASGGMGNMDHLYDAVSAGADAIAMADALHYRRMSLADIRNAALETNLHVRKL